MFQNIKNRISRKSAIGLTVFAIALTVSGVGSLAVLTDTATTVISASITSISLTSNGVTNASIDFGQVEPGVTRYAPVRFQNDGTGYLNLSLAATSNGSLISGDSKFYAHVALPAANCDALNAGSLNEAFAFDIAQPAIDLSPGVEGDGVVLAANGATLDICLVYRIGTTGMTYDQSGFQQTLTASAVHP